MAWAPGKAAEHGRQIVAARQRGVVFPELWKSRRQRPSKNAQTAGKTD
jgi:hypothetical protein